MAQVINICKLCLDMLDQLDDGVYIILHPDSYEVIIVTCGNASKKHYSKINWSLEQVIHTVNIPV